MKENLMVAQLEYMMVTKLADLMAKKLDPRSDDWKVEWLVGM